MDQFKNYAYFYNAFYKDKDYKKESNDVEALLKKYGRDIRELLVFGCGTGNHDVELSDMGYKCHGIDLSPEMINVARKRAQDKELRNTYEVADIRSYSTTKRYDAVLSLFHVMSYQTTNEDIKNALTSARKALSPSGLLIFDVWYGPGVLTDLPSVRIKEVEDDENRLIRLCRPNMYESMNAVDVNYEILVINKQTGNAKTINETHHMRYYFRPEMEEYLNSAGFELLETLDCKSLCDTDFSSWTCYFVARAI